MSYPGTMVVLNDYETVWSSDFINRIELGYINGPIIGDP